MTISMPCIEVVTIDGGTILEAQGAVLDLLSVRGAHPTNAGQNAQQLARSIASVVMAGELSLISALAAGHLNRTASNGCGHPQRVVLSSASRSQRAQPIGCSQ